MTTDAKVQVGTSADYLEGVQVTTPAGAGLFREGVVLSDPDVAAARAKIVLAPPDGSQYGVAAYILGSVVVTSVAGTVAVSAAALPLPAGAATSANQATEIAGLASIDGRLAGTLTVNTGLAQPLTDAQLRASAVPVSGPLTDAQLRASAVPVSGGADHALTFAGDKVDASGSTVTIAALDVALSTRLKPADTLTKVATVDTITNPVTVTGTVGVSGNVEVVNDVGNPLPVSAASLPLPTGAATDANLTALIGTLSNAPGAYTLLERLQQIGAKIDAQSKATAAQAATLLAALKPTPKTYTTLLHGR